MPSNKTIDLMPGEKMILYSNPHWWHFWKEIASAVVFLGFLILLASQGWVDNDVIGAVLGIAVIVIIATTVYAFIGWKTTRFAITDQRVAYQSGIVRRRGVSIPLNRVNNVNFSQSFIARLLNNGVVTIESAGETGDSVFRNIPDPENVRTLIFQQVEADEQADSDRSAASLAKAMQQHVPPPRGRPVCPGTTEGTRRLEDAGPRRCRRIRRQAQADPRRALAAGG